MKYTDRYDTLIRTSAGAFLRQYWGPDAWLWWKSELIAESALDPGAQSPVGAMGLAQFMPATWSEAKAELNLPADATPFVPHYAIRAGAYYLGKLRNAWAKVDRTESDRRRLAQASYNAGLGNIIKAQKAAKGAADYDTIIESLHKITGANSTETIEYVARIQRIYNELSGAAA
jgi:soluble lytic murein transglycosylase-like protein